MLEGETLEQAAVRELQEELNVEVTTVGQRRFSRRDPGSGFAIEFVEVLIRGEPMAREHAAFAWVQIHKLLEYELAPSDRAFAEWLVRGER